ncbi:MAG: hypothetical protein H6621_12255 [Halobacteriovoraceae bacterium]|nr:hypothetical protein [Halobacteriovoraceae bacterium]MCB9095832.1 hypothetical protein [Halobacteriovoraceae bacterium]
MKKVLFAILVFTSLQGFSQEMSSENVKSLKVLSDATLLDGMVLQNKDILYLDEQAVRCTIDIGNDQIDIKEGREYATTVKKKSISFLFRSGYKYVIKVDHILIHTIECSKFGATPYSYAEEISKDELQETLGSLFKVQ